MVTFGHLGGIDEIGIFLVPALLAVLALRWSERRARRNQAALDEAAADTLRADGQPEEAGRE